MAVRRGVRFKADDIWDTPDDGKRYEVIDGGMYVTPPPVWQHQYGSDTLFGYLWQYIHPRRLGRIVTAPVGVVLDDENGLQPDLVVEVLSPSTRSRDRGIKMRRYAAAGIPHYWILDPRTRALEAYELAGHAYELTGSHGPGTIFRPALFPGLEISIDDLWA